MTPPDSSLDAPPGMTWRETLAGGGTHIYFSGTPAPRGLVWLAWGLIALGVGYELLFNLVLWDGTSVVATEAVPVILLVLGATLAWRWRQGGSSSGVLDVGPGALRVQRGILLGPLQIPPHEVRELLVTDNDQPYQVQTGNHTVSETSRWYQVTLVTTAGKTHGLACFGEQACAAFYVERVASLVRGAIA